jgi:FkbM family methyltransferase
LQALPGWQAPLHSQGAPGDPRLDHGDFLFTSLPEGHSTNAAYLNGFQPKIGDVIIDAGAYCGLTTCLFSQAVGPGGKVIAVEADPHNFGALISNIGDRRLENVIPLNAAIWREAGVLQFAAEGNMGSAVAEVGPRQANLVSVEAVTLAGLCDRYGVDRVDHVKMDIEGAEYEVLLSSRDFVERFRPDFIVECHNEGQRPVDWTRLQGFFERRNYRARRLPQSENEIFPLIHFTPAKR